MSTLPETVPGPVESSSSILNPLFATCVAFIILDTLFVVARFTSRVVIGKVRLGWDDWWILPAWLFSVTLTVPALVLLHEEEKLHQPSNRVVLDPQTNYRILKSVYALVELLLAGYFTTRLSVLCLYLRLFSGTVTRTLTWCLIAIVTMQYIAFAIAGLVQCNPVSHFWNQAYDPLGGKCFDIDKFYRSITGPNIVTDVLLILLPIPSIIHLKISRLRKVGLTLIFCWSGLALIASCIRLKEYTEHTARYFAPNFTTPLVAWLVVEPGLYLIAACLPAMHHLLVAIVPRFIRNYVDSTVTKARVRNIGGPSKFRRNRASPSGTLRPDLRPGDFTRLVDSNGSGVVGTQATAKTTSHSTTSKNSEGMAPMDLEERPAGRNDMSMLPPDDMRRIQAGEGIIVRTDIITQEENIEKILGI